MRTRTSFWASLVQDLDPSPDLVMDTIRKAILNELDELKKSDVRDLDHRVGNAREINELWDARPELLKLIAAERGEDVARQRLDTITEMFRNY